MLRCQLVYCLTDLDSDVNSFVHCPVPFFCLLMMSVRNIRSYSNTIITSISGENWDIVFNDVRMRNACYTPTLVGTCGTRWISPEWKWDMEGERRGEWKLWMSKTMVAFDCKPMPCHVFMYVHLPVHIASVQNETFGKWNETTWIRLPIFPSSFISTIQRKYSHIHTDAHGGCCYIVHTCV